jgi:hypothetical protein
MVMVSMILADICWTLYFIKVGEKKEIGAGIWSSLIVLFGAVSTTEYVTDKTLIFAAMLGAFIGTYATVFVKNKLTEKNIIK